MVDGGWGVKHWGGYDTFYSIRTLRGVSGSRLKETYVNHV